MHRMTPHIFRRIAALPTTISLALPLSLSAVALPSLLLQACDSASGNAISSVSADVHLVERADFDMAIPVSGELAAMRQIEVRNRLESRAVITEIVPEGKSVKKGEVLLRLAEEEMRDRIKDAKDQANTAASNLIAAQQTLSIRENTRESELDKADVAIEMAQLSLLAGEHGEVVSMRQTLELGVKTADMNLTRLKDRFAESAKLVEAKFIAKDEFERDKIAMIEAEVKASQAALDLKVYQEYQFKQDEAQKRSNVDQAIAERKRTEQRNDAEIVKAKADVESALFKVESANDRLKQLELQVTYCTVEAPNDGLVVYATSIDSGGGGRGGGDAQAPQVGTELRPNELVIILPDTSQMVANLKVSEALSGRIRPGQSVTVYSDAMPNVPVTGSVQSVSVLAASGGWRDPNRRDYTVRVALDVDPALGLKPSMRCKAEILLDRVSDAVSVPVQAIFRQGPIAYVYVQEGGGFGQHLVTLGRSSELRVEVLDGIKEGNRVLLRDPLPEEIVAKLDFEALTQQLAPARETKAKPDQPPAEAITALDAPPEDLAAMPERGPPRGEDGKGAGKEAGDGPRDSKNRPERNGGRNRPDGGARPNTPPAG
ncbi:MAG: HlyD family efflux transporter periplasmic adaptor subunit [Phycisphaerae bacterium]|nr:HlyD family efflux transporter periplasmic adaptor subunit [Phycisphaerae bacterium]